MMRRQWKTTGVAFDCVCPFLLCTGPCKEVFRLYGWHGIYGFTAGTGFTASRRARDLRLHGGQEVCCGQVSYGGQVAVGKCFEEGASFAVGKCIAVSEERLLFIMLDCT